MRLIYSKPNLRDLSQGSRLAFIRQFKLMTQDYVAGQLGTTGECKRRTMTRYEKGERNPKDDRTLFLSNLYGVSFNAIKRYDGKELIDIIYQLMWLEELIPGYDIRVSEVSKVNNKDIIYFKKFINEWDEMKIKRDKKEISYEEYINWKFNYEIKEGI